MSCIGTALVACQTLQADLNQYFETCNAPFLREPMPFAEFIASELNNKGLRNVVSPGKGKKRTVELVYSARIPESEVGENVADLCVCTTERGNCSQTYEMDCENVSICEKIQATNLTDVCKDNAMYFAERVAYLMDAIERKLATTITEQAVALTGKWANDVANVNAADQLVVKTLKDGDAFTLAPFAFQEIDQALRKTGYCAPSVIFGGTALVNYYERIQAGCCADSGIDLAAMLSKYGKAVMWDRRVVNAFPNGENGAIVTQPGALALLWWNQFGWNEGVALPLQEGANYVRTLAITPRLGVPVDVIIKDECPGVVTITMSACVKLVNLPDDIFPAGDVYDGVNWFNEIRVTNV